jgi:hypothetical protein
MHFRVSEGMQTLVAHVLVVKSCDELNFLHENEPLVPADSKWPQEARG